MKKYSNIIILIILCLPIIQPLFTKGYFSMHDDTQIARVVVMGKAIRNGQLPVRWVSGLGYGYGYPLYNFYGPLPYYIGGFLYAAGLGGLIATKVVMVSGMMLSVLAMYALVTLLFGAASGILAGLLYGFAPYHAVQLYVRGAVGELWAYAFLPLLAMGILLLNRPKERNIGVWLGGIALAGIILSHTISGFVSLIFYLIGLSLYSFILLFRRRFHLSSIIYHLSLLFVGLGLSAFFWLPAITEMGYTNVAGQIGSSANYRDHFVCLPQFWNSLWGYGGSAPGCIDGMSFKIGKLHVLLGALGLGLAGFRLKRGFWSHPLGVISMIGLGSAVMAISISQPVWDFIPGLAFVQYPWRFLTGIALAISVLGGSVLFWVSSRLVRIGVMVVMTLGVIWLNAKVFIPQAVYDKPAAFFESEEELAWRVSGLSDEYLPRTFLKPENASRVARGILTSQESLGLRVETEINTETYAKLVTHAQNPVEVALNLVYFPGWKYWVNGVVQTVRVVNSLPIIMVPSGRSVVELRFTNTPARTIGNILSILVVLWFIRIYGKKIIT